MYKENIQENKEAMRTTNSLEMSSDRVINSSYPGGTKNFAALACETGGKACAPNCKIPRPPLMTSNSFNETLKSKRGKTKRAPSMIPRSRSRRRNENDKAIFTEKVKFDIPSKTESLKNEINDISVLSNEKSNGSLIGEEPGTGLGEYKNSGQKILEISSSLKASLNVITKEGLAKSTEAAQEESVSDPSDYEISERETQETRSVQKGDEKENSETDEKEAARQERTIRILYETAKAAMGPPFDNFKWTGFENVRGLETERFYFDIDSTADVTSIQGHYDITIKEISNIWKNTISLICSVRDHVVNFVEESNKLIDKEQLALEAEMLQLALDFAISYSKLKSDFLIKLATKHLNIKSLEKTELENFMDSKTFAALYNNDDLAAMARTVQDLNISLLRGVDLELE